MSDLRLNNAVLRGEIDNTRRGSVHVKLWLVGKTDPVDVTLAGDCLRDLAGSHIQFNHRPIEDLEPLRVDWSSLYKGQVGEITASARLCMHRPNEVGGYDKPQLVNVLRLEFFCHLGRVLLESFDFSCFLQNHTWDMKEDEEFAQRAENFAAWQDHIFRHPKYDIASDAQYLANLFDEINQRFADNYNFDQNEASLMGWDGIVNALADESESTTSFIPGFPDLPGVSSEDMAEFQQFLMDDMPDDDWDDLEEWEEASDLHPLVETVQELISDFEIQASDLTFPRGRHYQALINTLDDIEEGLRGLLNPKLVNEMPANTCIIGCREYLGKTIIALHHFSQLLEITETEKGRRELLFLRDGILDLREGISALRFELNNL